MQTHEMQDDWMCRALDAGTSALRAVSEGQPLASDDLVAGILALDQLAAPGRAPASVGDLSGVLQRMRALNSSPTLAQLPDGRIEAGRLLLVLKRIRSEL